MAEAVGLAVLFLPPHLVVLSESCLDTGSPNPIAALPASGTSTSWGPLSVNDSLAPLAMGRRGAATLSQSGLCCNKCIKDIM
jgi:hypothetical protein